MNESSLSESERDYRRMSIMIDEMPFSKRVQEQKKQMSAGLMSSKRKQILPVNHKEVDEDVIYIETKKKSSPSKENVDRNKSINTLQLKRKHDSTKTEKSTVKVGKEDNRTTIPSIHALLEFHCELCNTTMNSDNTFQTHLSGRRHQTALKNYPEISCKRTYSYSTKAVPIVQADIAKQKAPVVGLDFIEEIWKTAEGPPHYSCLLCNATTRPDAILNHILSSKHRLNYLKQTKGTTSTVIENLDVPKSVLENILTDQAADAEAKHGQGKIRVKTLNRKKAVTPKKKRRYSEEEKDDHGNHTSEDEYEEKTSPPFQRYYLSTVEEDSTRSTAHHRELKERSKHRKSESVSDAHAKCCSPPLSRCSPSKAKTRATVAKNGYRSSTVLHSARSPPGAITSASQKEVSYRTRKKGSTPEEHVCSSPGRSHYSSPKTRDQSPVVRNGYHQSPVLHSTKRKPPATSTDPDAARTEPNDTASEEPPSLPVPQHLQRLLSEIQSLGNIEKICLLQRLCHVEVSSDDEAAYIRWVITSLLSCVMMYMLKPFSKDAQQKLIPPVFHSNLENAVALFHLLVNVEKHIQSFDKDSTNDKIIQYVEVNSVAQRIQAESGTNIEQNSHHQLAVENPNTPASQPVVSPQRWAVKHCSDQIGVKNPYPPARQPLLQRAVSHPSPASGSRTVLLDCDTASSSRTVFPDYGTASNSRTMDPALDPAYSSWRGSMTVPPLPEMHELQPCYQMKSSLTALSQPLTSSHGDDWRLMSEIQPSTSQQHPPSQDYDYNLWYPGTSRTIAAPQKMSPSSHQPEESYPNQSDWPPTL